MFYDSALTLNVYGKDVKNIVNTILRWKRLKFWMDVNTGVKDSVIMLIIDPLVTILVCACLNALIKYLVSSSPLRNEYYSELTQRL